MTQNNESWDKGMNCPGKKNHDGGTFGRMFPKLGPFATDTNEVRQALLELGKMGGIMDPGDPNNLDNPRIPAGFTYFAQFIDHDITFDPTSSLDRKVDPEAVENFRTPMLELDNVYGRGPDVDPYSYDVLNRGKFIIEAASSKGSDLPRNSQNTALIGDPRNDENVNISQLHLAFLKFHNKVVDQIAEVTKPEMLFSEAQRLVRWHYQWIILHEFLPLIVGQKLVDKILKKGRKFYHFNNTPFIPIEFSVAAYRFGHSQVRPRYLLNEGFEAPIFDASIDPNEIDPNDLRGGKRAERRFVDWSNFFDTGTGTPQQGKRIDTKLSSPLFNLPFVSTNTSLAQRNLLRHLTFGIPSGQDVAKAMSIEPLDCRDLSDLPDGLDRSTPLWFYILREAEVCKNGKRLGPVGGRIVAEVLIGLLEGDSMSFLSQNPDWKPTMGTDEEFGIVDLLKIAGVV